MEPWGLPPVPAPGPQIHWSFGFSTSLASLATGARCSEEKLNSREQSVCPAVGGWPWTAQRSPRVPSGGWRWQRAVRAGRGQLLELPGQHRSVHPTARAPCAFPASPVVSWVRWDPGSTLPAPQGAGHRPPGRAPPPLVTGLRPRPRCSLRRLLRPSRLKVDGETGDRARLRRRAVSRRHGV